MEGSARRIVVEDGAGSLNAVRDEFPGVGHNSWDKAYGNQELYDWLLQHHLK